MLGEPLSSDVGVNVGESTENVDGRREGISDGSRLGLAELLLSEVGASLVVLDGLTLGIEERLGEEDGATGMLLSAASSAFKNPSTSSPSSSKANTLFFEEAMSFTEAKKFEGTEFHH
jgi:hypothetical protein